MKSKIIQERRESFLREVISEALGSLQDDCLNSLEVTRVQCSKGKHNAKVFIESSDITKEEELQINNAFKKARPILQEYILNATAWYNAPQLTLEFDNSLQIQNNLDRIFSQINKSYEDDK